MKQRYVVFDQIITGFMRGAEGGGYGKCAFLLFLAFGILIALAFAALFHFIGALGACAVAAVLAALALAHFDAYESEQAFKSCEERSEGKSDLRRRKKARALAQKKAV